MKSVHDTAALETLDIFLKENSHRISKERQLLHRGVTQSSNLFPAIFYFYFLIYFLHFLFVFSEGFSATVG